MIMLCKIYIVCDEKKCLDEPGCRVYFNLFDHALIYARWVLDAGWSITDSENTMTLFSPVYGPGIHHLPAKTSGCTNKDVYRNTLMMQKHQKDKQRGRLITK